MQQINKKKEYMAHEDDEIEATPLDCFQNVL